MYAIVNVRRVKLQKLTNNYRFPFIRPNMYYKLYIIGRIFPIYYKYKKKKNGDLFRTKRIVKKIATYTENVGGNDIILLTFGQLIYYSNVAIETVH